MLEQLIAACGAAIDAYGGTAGGLFVAGLVGGFLHCNMRCGVFVLGAMAARGRADASNLGSPSCQTCHDGSLNKSPVLNRLAGAALLPYHAGRILTYMLLAAVAASAGQFFVGPLQSPVWAASFLALAGFLFMAAAFGRSLWVPAGLRMKMDVWVSRVSRIGLFPMGMLLGVLPCALSAGAIIAAASTGDPLEAAVAMLAFGLATFLALFLPAYVAQGLLMKARFPAGSMNFILSINAVLLFAQAGRLMLAGG